ncbi:MAG: hypothetical protein ABW224_09580 [Kibdelosporangium sp.]
MPTYANVLVWVPAPVDAVRKAAHKSGAGQAAVVAVESGTVLVSIGQASDSDVTAWLIACRKAGRAVVALQWGRGISYPPRVNADVRLPGHGRRIRALGQAFQVSEDVVRPHVAREPTQDGVATVVALLEAVGKPDVARVAEFADGNPFDGHLDESLPGYKKLCQTVGWAMYLVLNLLAFFVLRVRLDAQDWVIITWTAVWTVVCVQFVPRYLMSATHIDRMLPVFQLPASDSQSAR